MSRVLTMELPRIELPVRVQGQEARLDDPQEPKIEGDQPAGYLVDSVNSGEQASSGFQIAEQLAVQLPLLPVAEGSGPHAEYPEDPSVVSREDVASLGGAEESSALPWTLPSAATERVTGRRGGTPWRPTRRPLQWSGPHREGSAEHG